MTELGFDLRDSVVDATFLPPPYLLTMVQCLTIHPQRHWDSTGYTLVRKLTPFLLKLRKTHLILHSNFGLYFSPTGYFSFFSFLLSSWFHLLTRTSFCFLSLNLNPCIDPCWCFNALMVSVHFIKVDQCFFCVCMWCLKLVPLFAFYISSCLEPYNFSYKWTHERIIHNLFQIQPFRLNESLSQCSEIGICVHKHVLGI